MRALVIQTAFAGDVILTTPLLTALHDRTGASIDVVCIPATAALLAGHPALNDVIAYDKRGGDSMVRVGRRLRVQRYDICISPHRSLRSALLARMSGAPIRISYDRSAGGLLYTHRVPYDPTAHEVRRCLDLLGPLGIDGPASPAHLVLPLSGDHHAEAARVLDAAGIMKPFVCLAPGSVWSTKRWTEEGFMAVGIALARDFAIVLLGGPDDRDLCSRIAASITAEAGAGASIVSTAGSISFLGSAALLGQARLLISNDSAPVHLASAVGTPVVEIFGATVPSFGFTPWGVPYETVDVGPLPCRPCGIHGGTKCPIGTFTCMRDLSPGHVVAAARRVIDRAQVQRNAGSPSMHAPCA